MLDKAVVDPDDQPPLPFQAADDYAQTVMQWAQLPMGDAGHPWYRNLQRLVDTGTA